jgi:hypothetical protein
MMNNNEVNLKANHKQRMILLVIMVLSTACLRFLPFAFPIPFHFSPVNAIALFSGAYFANRFQSFLVPLLSIWVSDLFLNYLYMHQFQPFYSGFYWQYGTYILLVILGSFLTSKSRVTPIVISSLSASLLFFVITNFGVWFSFNMYPKTFAGLVLCYEAAIPFFKTTLISDMCFTTLLFGIAVWVNKKYPLATA